MRPFFGGAELLKGVCIRHSVARGLAISRPSKIGNIPNRSMKTAAI